MVATSASRRRLGLPRRRFGGYRSADTRFYRQLARITRSAAGPPALFTTSRALHKRSLEPFGSRAPISCSTSYPRWRPRESPGVSFIYLQQDFSLADKSVEFFELWEKPDGFSTNRHRL